MIDWSAAQRIGELIAGDVASEPLPADLDRRGEDFAQRVIAYTGLTPAGPLPPPEAVDRRQWIAVNLDGMRPLLEPLADRMGGGLGPLSGAVRSTSGLILGAQVGVLSGLLSQRVLGQYELTLLDPQTPPRLLLVAGNIDEAARTLEVDREQLVSWVAVHEVTHAVQFGAVPWLREYLGGLLRELLDGLEVTIGPEQLLRLPGLDDLRALLEAVRRGELLQFVIGPERQALVDRIQAAMSLVEGHAEHVMDAVGAQVLPSLPQLRAALTRRRENRPVPWRLLERLLGLELKLRQYEVGRRFCDEVVQAGGMPALNRAWRAPEALPTLAELATPASWLKRTNVPVVTKSVL